MRKQKPEKQEAPTALERLVGLLEDGQVRSLAGLAGELGIGPEMVTAMLGELVRRGYLREVPAASCPGRCQGCALGAACVAAEPGRAWAWGTPARPTRA